MKTVLAYVDDLIWPPEVQLTSYKRTFQYIQKFFSSDTISSWIYNFRYITPNFFVQVVYLKTLALQKKLHTFDLYTIKLSFSAMTIFCMSWVNPQNGQHWRIQIIWYLQYLFQDVLSNTLALHCIKFGIKKYLKRLLE